MEKTPSRARRASRLRLVPTIAVLALALAGRLTPAGAARPAVSRAGILTIDEIRPGMVGVGKTVFRGTQIEDFQVEILSVLRNVSPDGDMILARASGGPLVETGIIAGMSGSPVYVDGKLIGAVAFAWSFSKQPIAGITPIEEMFDVMDREDLGPAGSRAAPRGTGELGRADDAGDAAAGFPSGTRLVPIQTPVSVSGFDARVVDRFLPWLERRGFTATIGGGTVAGGAVAGGAGGSVGASVGAGVAGGSPGGASDAAQYEALPGAAVGVQLVSGDASVTAIGTITHRDGDRLIAFGHPLFQAGDVDLPMTGAYIHAVLPSALSSFKLGTALAPLGTLTQDRRTAISGNIGAVPRSIPVSVTLHTGAGPSAAERAFHYAIVDDKSLTPGLVQFTTTSSVLASEASFAEQTMTSRVVYRLAGGRTIVLENLFSGFSSLDKLADEVSAPALLLFQNRFERAAIEAIDVEIRVSEERRSGRLESISVARNPIRAGETLDILATVKTYQGPLRVVPMSIVVPAGTEDGDLMLRVSDASTLDESETKRAPQRYEWEDLATFLDALEMRRRNDRLYAQLEATDVGIAIAGHEFPQVPRSFFAVIDSDRHTENAGTISASLVAKSDVDIDLVVSGAKTLTVRVDHRTP